MSAQGELAMTMLATIAEEERKSISQNVKWSIRKHYSQGRMLAIDTEKLLGYDKTGDRTLAINEQEAEIVKLIFELYRSGVSSPKLATYLNSQGIPSYKKQPWNSQRILSILSNEKYAGDVLLQKHYIDERGKEVINRGQQPQYLVENHHPAIISREAWNQVQEIRKRKRRTK